jgi:hypothetical protein
VLRALFLEAGVGTVSIGRKEGEEGGRGVEAKCVCMMNLVESKRIDVDEGVAYSISTAHTLFPSSILYCV